VTDDVRAISKSLSWILRHAADELGLVVDPEGYARVDDVLAILRRDHPLATYATIEAVVAHDPVKQRFRIDGDWIRANYGHSLAHSLDHPRAVPPDVLLHGTSAKALAAVLAHGLLPMQRQYVHLTTDPALALQVGGRHGKPVLLAVDARAAHAAGVGFYRANAKFWLADAVPASFLSRTNAA
jgi:putative RNA 2'-phosphotransferase